MANALTEIKRIIAQEIIDRESYGDADYTYELAERQNEDGWTFETPAPRGNIVRHEAVHLSPEELRQVYAAAKRQVTKS